ncbi:hypothetical protein ACY3C9_002029 [Listeria monocytogenes]
MTQTKMRNTIDETIQIAERLRRSPSAIKSRAWALGVKKRDGGAK